MYFNRRYKRVGSLFQGHYKGVLVETDEQLLYLTRYIHRNDPRFKQPSSYPNYLGRSHQDWVKPEFILQHFSQSGFNSYQAFVEADDTETEAETARVGGPFYLES
jgi:putative transposase